MDISKLDAGAVTPSRSRFALAPMLARLEREFAPLAATRRLRLSIAPTSVWVDSDPVLLERVLANLVSNAVRHTERGGAVVGVRRRGPQVAIEVRDSGGGIPARERERIFEAFYQIRPGARAGGGMGLGLAIIRRLAALLEHPVEVDSTVRGSRFAIIVPRAQPAVPCLAQRTRRGARGLLAGAMIAVVDDESSIIDAMRVWFAQWGATVCGAGSGEDVLAALGELGRSPDLIVADYRLAGAAVGTDAVALLRTALGEPIPAVLISGDASAEAFAAMRATAPDVLLKPVLPAELRALAERLLAARSLSGFPGAASTAMPVVAKKAPRKGAREDRPSS